MIICHIHIIIIDFKTNSSFITKSFDYLRKNYFFLFLYIYINLYIAVNKTINNIFDLLESKFLFDYNCSLYYNFIFD